MQLGIEKHQLAVQCARERLGALIPGRFSLEQRYRHDQRTGERRLISNEEAQALLRRGCGDELEGTLRPDVVIHSGNPLDALAVYDFKFTCPTSNPPRWSVYPEGHPYSGLSQGELYQDLLKVEPHLVAPIWKIIRWPASPK